MTVHELRARLREDRSPKSSNAEHSTSLWQRFLASKHASMLTHGSIVLLTAAKFWLLLNTPLWFALVPCALIEHRIGIMIHEYIHGIPFTRYKHSRWVITFFDGMDLCFGLLEVFRVSHLTHHRWLNTERDPAHFSVQTVEQRKGFVGLLLSLEFPQHVLYLWSALRGRVLDISPWRVAAGAALSVGWIVFWVAMGYWWMWPVLQGLVLFSGAISSSLRGAAEHHSYPGDPNYANEYKVVIPAFHINRHVHHHIDPSCPWYRLQFVTDRTLPIWAPYVHWYKAYVQKSYVLMQPMKAPREDLNRLDS